MKNTTLILKELKTNIQKQVLEEVAQGLSQLEESEPTRWLRLLFDNSLIPEPYMKPENKDFTKRITFLKAALASVDDAGTMSKLAVAELRSVLLAGELIHARLASIAQKLQSIPLTQLSRETQLFCIGGFVEAFVQHFQREEMAQREPNQPLDFTKGMQASIPDREGIPTYSTASEYETMVLAAELAFRYILHKTTLSESPIVDFSRDEIEQTKEILRLGSIWKQLENLWADVRYSGWRPQEETEEIIFAPDNKAIVADTMTDRVREMLYIALLSADFLTLEPRRAKYLHDLVASVRFQDGSWKWDGKIDISALAALKQYSPFLETASEIIRVKHYEPFLGKIQFEGGSEKVGWSEWLNAINVIRDLSQVLLLARNRDNHQRVERGYLPSVFIVNLDQLVRIMADATNMSEAICHVLIRSLILNPKAKSVDAWDQPLLPISANDVMVLPSLALFGHPRGIIEDFIIENVGADALDLRNVEFEKYVAEIMEQGEGAEAVTNVKFNASDGKEVEFDVIVWWGGYIFLIEVKCQRSSYDAADEYRVWSQVEEAIEQLKRRREVLASDWNAVVEKAKNKRPDLSFPEKCPSPEKVVCIAVTNTFRFSSLSMDGVVVTDDVCLNRYFGEQGMPMTMLQGSKLVRAEVGQIRATETPTPNGLLEYLSNPLQIALVRKYISLRRHRYDTVDGEKPLGCYIGSYTGSSEKMLSVVHSMSDELLQEMADELDQMSA